MKRFTFFITILGLFTVLVGGDRSVVFAQSTEANLKVAFIGDAGVKASSTEVLKLIKNEGAAMVIHSGDFDYNNDPTQFENSVSNVLGSSFPYFISAGNHDAAQWSGYQSNFKTRLSKIVGATCTGDYGNKSHCTYKGLSFILSGIGTLSGGGDSAYITQEFQNDPHVWKICSWHKNQRTMQLGDKSDEVGWAPYQACKDVGAIIATAHEHSYERTKTLIDIQNHTIDPTCSSANSLCVSAGKSFVFVSGLGGASARVQLRCTSTNFTSDCNQWASIYTKDQGAGFGVLFIVFNYQGNPNKAHGYFKTIAGTTVDTFDIVKGQQQTTIPSIVTPTIRPSISIVPTVNYINQIPSSPTPTINTTVVCNPAERSGVECYQVWVQEFLGDRSTIVTDFNQDGKISLIDFEVWRRGQTPNPSVAVSVTPRPSISLTPLPTNPGVSMTQTPTPVVSLTPMVTAPPISASKGYMTNIEELRARKRLADSGTEPYKSAVADVLSYANAHMGNPSPQTSINIPGTDGPFVTDSGVAYAMGLAYGLTGDVKYAQKARQYINAWVTTAKSTTNACPDSGSCQTALIIGRNAPAFVFAADLIKSSGVFTATEDNSFKNWLRTVILPTSSIRTNNWGDAGTMTRVVVTDYIGDSAGFASAIAKLKSMIDLIAADGHIPEETRRGSSGITYSEESLDYKLVAVKTAERRGINLWNYGRLKLATDYLAKYMLSPGSWPWASGAGNNIHGLWEIAYEHWKTPIFRDIAVKARPYGVFHSATEFTTLTNGIP